MGIAALQHYFIHHKKVFYLNSSWPRELLFIFVKMFISEGSPSRSLCHFSQPISSIAHSPWPLAMPHWCSLPDHLYPPHWLFAFLILDFCDACARIKHSDLGNLPLLSYSVPLCFSPYSENALLIPIAQSFKV